MLVAVGRSFVVLALVASAACSPTFDWREIAPEGDALVALFPCRPDRHERQVALASGATRMHMLVCAAGGATFALSFVDVATPAGVATALADLRAAAAANLGAAPSGLMPLFIAGGTVNAESGRLVLAGRLPDGTTVQEQAAFFTKGLRIYQASVIGAKPTADAIDTFFAGLKFPSPR